MATLRNFGSGRGFRPQTKSYKIFHERTWDPFKHTVLLLPEVFDQKRGRPGRLLTLGYEPVSIVKATRDNGRSPAFSHAKGFPFTWAACHDQLLDRNRINPIQDDVKSIALCSGIIEDGVGIVGCRSGVTRGYHVKLQFSTLQRFARQATPTIRMFYMSHKVGYHHRQRLIPPDSHQPRNHSKALYDPCGTTQEAGIGFPFQKSK